jgi:hypothetical protein
MEDKMRPLKRAADGPPKVEIHVKFDKYDKNKDLPFKPLEDSFARKYIINIESLLLRVTREELKRQSEESIYPPIGVFYAPSNRKTKPRKRLPYLPKLIREQ